MKTLGKTINKIRTEAKLTQEQFSQIFGVSQQSVQRWESGVSSPDLEKVIMISKYFGISLDALILGNDNRVVDEMKKTKVIKPHYKNIHDWEFYSSNLLLEYEQSLDEGLDIEIYKDVFFAASRLPKGEIVKKLGDKEVSLSRLSKGNILLQIADKSKETVDVLYHNVSDEMADRFLRYSDTKIYPWNKGRDVKLASDLVVDMKPEGKSLVEALCKKYIPEFLGLCKQIVPTQLLKNRV